MTHKSEVDAVAENPAEAVNQNTHRKPLREVRRGSWAPRVSIPAEPNGSESQSVTSSRVIACPDPRGNN